MVIAFITIITISIILFISSFFMQDKVEELEGQVEQLSLSTMQDTYQLKKKIRILEEELLYDHPSDESNPSDQPTLIQRVIHLHKQGYPISDIEQLTSLSNHEIQKIINHSE